MSGRSARHALVEGSLPVPIGPFEAAVLHHAQMTILYDDLIDVHYGFIYLSHDGDVGNELIEERLGQINGLLGAKLPGRISMMTGLHTGQVPLVVAWSSEEPPLSEEWEDVVEASYLLESSNQTLSSFETFLELAIPATGQHRVRLSATGMDAGRELDTPEEGQAAPDRYRLDLWPSPSSEEQVLRQTSEAAAYWHAVAQGESN